MIIIFLFFIFFILVDCNYKTSYKILTPFKNKKKLINFLSTTDFFKKYLEKIGAEKINFNPSIINKNTLNNEQSIEYTYKPVIRNLPLLNLKKINISHNWKIYHDKFIGTIKTYYICFDMEIYTRKLNNELSLIFDAKIINKKFFIPNKALKYAIIDFGNIFLEIIDKTEKVL